jgi:hypothetical protein
VIFDIMKQFERIAVALSDATAVIQEKSCREESLIPSLTIMIPFREAYNGQESTPPMSITLFGSEVDNLLNLLCDYYHPPIKKP